jgi:hypothetical protein
VNEAYFVGNEVYRQAQQELPYSSISEG